MDSLERRVHEILKKASSPVSFAELARRLELRSAQRRGLRAALASLQEDGKIRRLANKHYTIPTVKGRRGTVEGRLTITSQGFGFVRPRVPYGEQHHQPQDIFVRARDLGEAMEGDLVAVEVVAPARGDRNPTGVIRGILKHANEQFTGWFQRASSRRGRVTPRNPRIGRVVDISKKPEAGWPEDYQWVVVRVTGFTPAPQPLVGEITEILGEDETPGIDVLMMLRDRGIVAEFPKAVEQEAASLTVDWEKELETRADFRAQPVITIDPATAKDFDDALSIKTIGRSGPDKRWILRVHIADVSYFVRNGTELDEEALRRGNSIYPVDRVVPMLPERLSSDLCSLRPGTDRLTMTVEMEISAQGEVLRSGFYRSVIHSRHRMTYHEAQAVFDRSDPQIAGRFGDVAGDLQELRDLARVLRRRRIKRGALDLDIPEPEIVFDAQGRAIDIRHYPRLESHQLVEECMLIANEVVADHLTRQQIPMLYRIHEPAQPRQLNELEPLLKALGIRVSFKGDLKPQAIQRALAQAEKRPAGHILRRLILRALTRARYSAENAGHFGLASPCYCHFTSPIRRYPDLVVHRALVEFLEGREAPKGEERKRTLADLAEAADQCSDTERQAQEIEWDTTALKSLEFMQKHLGQEFEGYVSSVQTFGLFVELDPYPVEGLIPLDNLPPDRYEIDDLGVRLTGRRRGKRYQLTDRVRVQVEHIDLTALQMDLKIVE